MKKINLKETIRKSLNLVNEAVILPARTFALKTEFLSQGNKDSHIKKYEMYIEKATEVSIKLDSADRQKVNNESCSFRSLKLDETHTQNGQYLHELYFENISDLASEINMDTLAYMKIARAFGSFDNWQKDFLACCQASRNGWAALVFNMYTATYQNILIDSNEINIPVSCIPVIVIDVHDHAYYRDYLNEVKTYSAAMMKELNWNIIEKRVERVESIKRLLENMV